MTKYRDNKNMEKKKIVLNIHSMSSVITNSSEMIYVVDDGKTEKEILNVLKPYMELDKEERNCSGNGGEVVVYDREDGDDRVILMVDWSMEHTLAAINDIFGYKSDN